MSKSSDISDFDQYSCFDVISKNYIMAGDLDFTERLQQEVRLYDIRIKNLLEMRNIKMNSGLEEKGTLETILKIDAEITRIQKDRIGALILIKKATDTPAGFRDADICIRIDDVEY